MYGNCMTSRWLVFVMAVVVTAAVVVGCPQTPKIKVPNVAGKTQEAAESAITSAGLTVGKVTQEYSATVPNGKVIRTNPAAGAEVEEGSAVALVLSKGPEPVTVPNVVGMTESQATQALEAANLTVSTTEGLDSSVPVGSIISQEPAAGSTVEAGSAVALVISVDVTAGGYVWPLAVGNTWSFAASQGNLVESKALYSRDIAIMFTVSDHMTVNGYDVWQVDINSPVLGGYYPYYHEKEWKSSHPLGALATMAPIPQGYRTYWVSLDSEWHITLFPDAVSNLPSREGFAAWPEIEETFAKVLYTVYSQDGYAFAEELRAIEEQLSANLDALDWGDEDEEDDYCYEDEYYYEDDYYYEDEPFMDEGLVALLEAYGTDFANYTNDSVFLTGLTRISATLAAGVPKVQSFVESTDDLMEQFDVVEETYYEDLDAYMTALEADEQPLIDMIEALGADFSEYSSPQAILQDVVRIGATLAAGAQEMADFTDEAEAIIDQLELDLEGQYETLNVYMDAQSDDPQGIASLVEAFAASFDGYSHPDLILQDVGRILAAAADSGAVMLRNSADYTDEEWDYLNQFVMNVSLFVESQQVMVLVDPVQFVDDLTAYVEESETTGTAAADARALLLGVLPGVRTLVVDIETLEEPVPCFDGVILFVDDLQAFFTNYANDNPGDALALYVSTVLTGVYDVLDSADYYLGDTLDDLDQELTILYADLEATEWPSFSAAGHEVLMNDLSAWLDNYAIANNDVLAAYLSETTGLLAEFMGVVERDLGWILDDLWPQVSDFFEDLENLPEDDVTFARTETLLSDLEIWFKDYGQRNSYVPATAFGLYAGAGADVVGATDAYLAGMDILIEDQEGALGTLMPVVYPMSEEAGSSLWCRFNPCYGEEVYNEETGEWEWVDSESGVYEAYEITVDDVVVGDQTNCLSRRLWIEGPDDSKFWLPLAIYSQDIGPVVLGPFTLEHAIVDGTEYAK